MKKFFIAIVAAIACLMLLSSCEKEQITFGNGMVQFSQKTLTVTAGKAASNTFTVLDQKISSLVFRIDDSSVCSFEDMGNNTIMVTGKQAGKTYIYCYENNDSVSHPILGGFNVVVK